MSISAPRVHGCKKAGFDLSIQPYKAISGAVPEGLTLEQVNLEEVENHMAVIQQIDLKVEDVGIIQGGQVIQLASH